MDNYEKNTYRGWEYAKAGDYHRKLDPNWSYTPTYLRKMAFVRKKVQSIGKEARILDAGCGEGVLVEDFLLQGYQIKGLDMNYESQFVQRGSIVDIPYESNYFDMVLLLDVFEHLAYSDQPAVLLEIRRVLKAGGILIATIPNLAHLNSRFTMAFFGQLDRTDIEVNHVGERPLKENLKLIKEADFLIDQIRGITLTVPFIYRHIICRRPSWFRWLHDLLEPVAIPSLAMINIFVCRKR